MKTLEVSDEQYDRLKKMAELMQTQDNRATRLPLYCIYQKKEVERANEGEHCAYFCTAYDWSEVAHDDDELIEWFKDKERVMEETGCREEVYNDIDGDNEDYGAENIAIGLDLTRYYYDIEGVPVPGEIFFTEVAAQAHIDANGYHYTKPYIFVNSAWRNKELEVVMDVVAQITNPEGAHR